MGKKRKAGRGTATSTAPEHTKYAQEERFDDSEDEFYASRDKILLEDGPATKKRRQLVEQENDLQPSDEEVLQYSGTDDDDLDEVQSAVDDANTEDEEEGDGDGVWGSSKADYYNADAIETEADAIEEENEARRLQAKQLKNMTNADYGFDELQWNRADQEISKAGTVIEKLPEVRIPIKAGRQEKVDILESRYPEFVPLAKDLAQLQDTWKSLQLQATETQADMIGVTPITKLRALSSYLGAIVMYFAVVTSKIDATADPTRITALSPNELREHAVIKTLMEAREMWDTVKGVQEVVPQPSQPKTEIVTITPSQVKGGEKTSKKNVKARVQQKKSISESEDGFDLEALAPLPVIETKQHRTKPIALQSLLAQTTTASDQGSSDFGDEDPLTAEQAADKAKRKNSLRFYTSQIAQKANKRGAASRQAGGDDDVPRKERLRDKQERLLKDAEKRGQQKPTGDEELGDDDDSEGMANGEEDPYYQSLVAASNRKKAAKQERSKAYAEAAKLGAQVYEAEQIGPDGKRKITYAIEKNKGLTPKRKKDVRNPRVKKRKKFDEKMKKLGSIRQVYKGGEGKGGYGGELTGIKTNVVKSVKL